MNKSNSNSISISKNIMKNTKGIPLDFVCPLIGEIMIDPIMCVHGYSCERSAIFNYLESGKTTCPLTGLPISIGDFVSNIALRMRIMKWQILHDGDVHLFSPKSALFDLPPNFITRGGMEEARITNATGEDSNKSAEKVRTPFNKRHSFSSKVKTAFRNKKKHSTNAMAA
jgi:hypothetical protein